MPRAVLVAGGTGGFGPAVLSALLDAVHPVTATWRSECEEIARVVRFLVSEESAPISGAAVPGYGGA